jgi:hypothetical protein
MKKKVITIACSILGFVIFTCLFTVFFQWRFHSSRLQEGLMSKEEAYDYFATNLDDDNAAKYYLKAVGALKSPEEVSDISNRFAYDPEYTGLEDDPAIAELLERNRPVFDFVRDGINQNLCTVPNERLRDYAFFISDLRQIGRLHALRGKLFEKNGELEKAAATYLDLLRFGHDISSLGGIHTLIGRNIEGMSIYHLPLLVNRIEDEARCRELLADLMNLWGDTPPLHDSINATFSELRTNYDNEGARWALYVGGLAFAGSYDFESADELERRRKGTYTPSGALEYFTDTFDRVGWYLWFQITKSSGLSEMDRVHDMILQASSDCYHGILSEGIEEKVSNGRITQNWFSPTYRNIQAAARGETNRRATLIQIALRIHYLTNDEYPETFEDLTPIVPEEFLIDPFSAKRFVYKKTEDGYLFYSFGPDLEDDDGDPRRAPHEDIVFTFPRVSRAELRAPADNNAGKADPSSANS